MTQDKLNLPFKYKRLLEGLFKKHLPKVEVLAYGSRIKGYSHPGSDLDLALKAPDLKKIPSDKLNALRLALRESSIPFLVEVRDLALLPKSFQTEIEKHHIVLFSHQQRIEKQIGSLMRKILQHLEKEQKMKLNREKKRIKQRKLKKR